MIIFKSKYKYNFYFLIISVAGLGLIFYLMSDIFGSLFIIVVFLVIQLINFLHKRLSEIQINKLSGCLTLIYKNNIKEIKIKNCALSKIQFTYKKEMPHFKGGIKDVCTIYYEDKKILKLIPEDDDWDDYEIYMLVKALIKSGTEKKFVGHLLRDVEI